MSSTSSRPPADPSPLSWRFTPSTTSLPPLSSALSSPPRSARTLTLLTPRSHSSILYSPIININLGFHRESKELEFPPFKLGKLCFAMCLCCLFGNVFIFSAPRQFLHFSFSFGYVFVYINPKLNR